MSRTRVERELFRPSAYDTVATPEQVAHEQPQHVATQLLGQRTGALRLASIDALRGIAALAVVLTHIPRDHQGEVDASFVALLPLDFGTLGVPLFLVISGFCIHLAVARRALASGKAAVDWRAFWKRRFFRLYPPYVAAIAFSLAAYVVAGASGHLRPDDEIRSLWPDLAAHLLLVHNLFPAFDTSLFNPALWTLALEEQLYALFALVLVLRRRMPIIKVMWISLAVTLAWRWGITWTEFALVRTSGIPREAQVVAVGGLPAIGSWELWPFAYWFLWVAGAVAAEGYARAITLPPWCYSWRLAAGFTAVGVATFTKTLGRYAEFWLTDEGVQGWLRAALNTAEGITTAAFGVAFFIVLNRWVRSEQEGRFSGRWAGALTAIGVFSYSLYLVHIPTIRLLEVWLPIGPPSDLAATIARTLIYVPICVAVAYGFFVAVERHFLKHHKGQRTS